MENKKLIGTILGVIAFVALIAGATFAWLSANATVTNTVFNNTVSKNFTFTYVGGSDIGNPKQLALANCTKANITSEETAATAGDGWAAITASKGENTPPAKTFRLVLTDFQNTITTNSVLYAVCIGNCPDTALITALNGTTATCATGVAKCGVIPPSSSNDVILLDDTTTFNKNGSVSTTTYNVYFWLNSATIANADMGKGIVNKSGKTAHIKAIAAQDAAGLS